MTIAVCSADTTVPEHGLVSLSAAAWDGRMRGVNELCVGGRLRARGMAVLTSRALDQRA
jgi:hypothetical protein